MLTPKQKQDFLEKLRNNLEQKIYDSDMEVRLWERRKISASNEQLLAIEKIIGGIKGDKGILSDKLDIVEDEIKDHEKLTGKKSGSNNGGPDSEKEEG